MITKEYLEKKVTELKAQHLQLQGNTHAVSGAIQFAEHLLRELVAAAKKPATKSAQK